MSPDMREVKEALEAFPPFSKRVDEECSYTYDSLEVMQVNIGLRCNLSCKHCHVDAGPYRNEFMTRETMETCLDVFIQEGFKTLDITGGAPEMNPDFEWFIQEAHRRGIAIMIRSNLVILHEEDYRHLPELYAEIGAVIVASLPHYSPKTMEKQRGSESFNAVIHMLQKLNSLGYGKGSGLELNLVFNPGGAFLPPEQSALEQEYRQNLAKDFNIVFDNLFAITNNPSGRFGSFLQKSGNLEGYMQRLMNAFNSATLTSMMCRNQISVGWDGKLYDCDFNQANNLVSHNLLTIADLAESSSTSLRRKINFGNHCYACCAGAGSSCGGATA